MVPFQKGQSGNPGGRPKGMSLVAQLKEELLKPASGSTTTTNKEMVAHKLVQMAIAGDVPAIRLCFEYIDGKATQPVEHSGEMEIITVEKIRQAIGLRVVSS